MSSLEEIAARGFWSASIFDQEKGGRLIHIDGRYNSEAEALTTAKSYIQSGWYSSYMIRTPAKPVASYVLSRENIDEIGRYLERHT